MDKDVVLLSEIKSAIRSEIEELRDKSASDREFQVALDKLVRQALDEAINSRLLVREARKDPKLAVDEKGAANEVLKVETERHVRHQGSSLSAEAPPHR